MEKINENLEENKNIKNSENDLSIKESDAQNDVISEGSDEEFNENDLSARLKKINEEKAMYDKKFSMKNMFYNIGDFMKNALALILFSITTVIGFLSYLFLDGLGERNIEKVDVFSVCEFLKIVMLVVCIISAILLITSIVLNILRKTKQR